VGRLAPGVDLEQARADLRTVASRIAAAHPDSNAGNGIDLAAAQDSLAGHLRPPLLRLLGAVTFVLLIACANAGHLLLTRAAERDREMAVRAALGATRGWIIRLWLLKGLLLGLAGGAAGLLLAVWGLDLLLAFLPLDLPATIEIGIGRPALAFALGISLLASLLAGLVPALHAAWPNLAESLKQGGRGATESPARRRTRQLLVTTDMALALVLLIGAGLMLRSLERILRYDPGFRSDGVLTLSFEPPSNLSGGERVHLKRKILETVGALPGVRSAALTSHILFDHLPVAWDVATEGSRAGELVRVQTFYISSAYFQTLEIPLERGRGFAAGDHQRPVRTVIVNRALAERSWPGRDPLGRWLTIGPPGQDNGDNTRRFRVIGVAGNVRTAIEPGAPREPLQMYLPALEESYWGTRLVLAVREGDPASLAPDALRVLRDVDPRLSIFNVAPLADRVARATAATRFFTALLGLFAGLALVLAVLGIYGLISYTVQRQSREIAIRRLLGAGPWVVLRLLVARALGPALLGIALGVGGALTLSQTMAALLFDIAPLDPPTFLSVPLLFAAVALAASLLSAQKALEIDPAVVLRDEA
jgi:predicted permease